MSSDPAFEYSSQSPSLGGEISSGGKKSQELNSDNTGGTRVGEAIGACSGGICNSLVASYARMTSIYGSSYKVRGSRNIVAKVGGKSILNFESRMVGREHRAINNPANGNIKKSLGRDSKEGIIILPLVSFEEHVAVQRETKARTLLLQSLPEDHMADFHHLDDAREIWLAVKARFDGNEESKKMRKILLKQAFSEFSVSEEEGLHKDYDRFQKILSQLNQMQAKPDNDDVNIKFLRALSPSWSQVILTLKTRGGLEYLSFDDLYNKLRSLEIDVKGGSSYGSRSTTVAPTHSAFIGAASTNTKMVYSDQPSYSSSISYTPVPSSSIMKDVDQLKMEELDIKWQMDMLSLRIKKFQKKADIKINFNNKDSARFNRRRPDATIVYSWDICKRVQCKEENKTEEAEQVYGLMAGFKSDFAVHVGNAADDVNSAAVEFSMMGISPKVQTCPFECDSKLSDLKKNYKHLEKLYNDSFIQVQAYKNTVKALEHQKDWYHTTQLALEEKVRILSANLKNTTNTLKYSETLYDQAKHEKKEWEVKFVESLARFDKWKESSKHLAKLLYSSMSTRTKLSLGFKEYIRSDEVCDLSTPSVFDPEPDNREVKSLYERFIKAGNMHEVPPPITGTLMPTSYQSDLAETQATFGLKSNTSSFTTSDSNDSVSCDNSDKSSASKTSDFASCVSSPKTNDSFSTVDVKFLPKSDVKNTILTNGLPSCSFKENVKPPRNLCNKSGTAKRIPCKNNFARIKKCFVCGSKSHLIKDCNVYDTVDNFLSVVSKAASVPAGRRNSLASTTAGRSIPAASRNKSASIYAGRSIPAASRNRSASIHAGRSIPAASRNRPTSIHDVNHILAGRINKPTPVPAGSSVPTDLTCNGVPRIMVDLINLYGFTLNDPQDIGIVDSGCSRSMTGNKDKLDDFVQASYKAISAVRTISEPLQLLHMDLFGPTSIRSIDHKYYSLVVTDDFSRFCWAFFMGTKDETFYILKDFIALIENQLNKKVKAIRCDNRTEFRNAKLIALCGEKGIKRDYSNARTPQQNGVAERKNQTLIKAARSMLANSKLPTMFWTEAVSTAYYVLNRVSITNPHNKTPYELLSGKVPNIQHLKPFGCQVTILNTSDHLGKFEGKANDGFLVGYAAHSKAYRIYNLSSKKVEETLNLRYLEDKPNVQGLGQELYFDLDYLTDSLGYTRFKTNPPAGTHNTNILAGTQADDSESECDEHVILVPSFPFNSFSGPTVHDVSAPMENNLDYAEELARLQRQEYEAHSVAAKQGFEFTDDIAVLLHPAAIETRRNLVLAARDLAPSIVSTGGVPVGNIPASGVPAGSLPASGVPAGSVPASGVPAGSLPASSVPVGGVLAGSIVSVEFGDPAASASVPGVFSTDTTATSPLPPGYLLGSCEHTVRFSSPSDHGNHQPTADIFSSSSYDDDFYADVTNLASNVVVDPVATKRVNTIHPQSQIIGALQSPIQTRSTVQKSKFGKSAFLSYIHNQNRTNHADHLHCLFACFLSQLEPSSVAKALEDPDWVAAMQEEMQ
nr:retrovirus-related Pol polyprotein from transposon TNT 1-94 [Tanacetum cinerariifolium]